jgi:hypothetical protein
MPLHDHNTRDDDTSLIPHNLLSGPASAELQGGRERGYVSAISTILQKTTDIAATGTKYSPLVARHRSWLQWALECSRAHE